MAKLDTTYYLLSQTQLYAMLVDVVAQTDSYRASGCTPMEAHEMAISDILNGVDKYNAVLRKNHASLWSRLMYYVYKKRVWKNGMTAMSFDEWHKKRITK